MSHVEQRYDQLPGKFICHLTPGVLSEPHCESVTRDRFCHNEVDLLTQTENSLLKMILDMCRQQTCAGEYITLTAFNCIYILTMHFYG